MTDLEPCTLGPALDPLDFSRAAVTFTLRHSPPRCGSCSQFSSLRPPPTRVCPPHTSARPGSVAAEVAEWDVLSRPDWDTSTPANTGLFGPAGDGTLRPAP